MSLLAILGNFAPGTPIISAEVNAVEAQLVNTLNGTLTNKNILVRYSAASDPPADFDQLGAGLLARWKTAGVTAVTISNAGNITTVGNVSCVDLAVSGDITLGDDLTVTGDITGAAITSSGTVQGTRLISTIALGTAPLTVTSTTKVANLNADQVDGLEGADFVRKSDTVAQSVASDLAIAKVTPVFGLTHSTGSKTVRMVNDGTDWLFIDDVAGNTPLSIALATGVPTFGINPIFASDPTTSNQLARKAYVDKFVRQLDYQEGNATTSGTGETDLLSYTLPANTLTANGDSLELVATWEVNSLGGGGSQSVRLRMAGQEVFGATRSSATSALNTFDISVRIRLTRTGSDSLRGVITYATEGIASLFVTTGSLNPLLTGFDFTSTNVIKITGQTSLSGDPVAGNFLGTTKHPAP